MRPIRLVSGSRHVNTHSAGLLTAGIILAALAGCATPSNEHKATLEQGAYRPAIRPPVFSPAEDAPHTVGQPGHVGPSRQYPRALPGQRILPESPETRREDTIWASKQPPGAKRKPAILGVMLPPSLKGSPDEYVPPTYWCAALMDGAAKKILGETKLLTSTKRCLAARLYLTCMVELTKLDLALQEKKIDVNFTRSALLNKATKTASTFEQSECPSDILKEPDFSDLEKRIVAEANKVLGTHIQ